MFAAMRWIAVPIVVVLVVLGGVTGLEATAMQGRVTGGEDYQLESIDGEGVGYGGFGAVVLRLSPHSVRVEAGTCGAWVAPMRVDAWKGLISIGVFKERMWTDPNVVDLDRWIDTINPGTRLATKNIRAALKADRTNAARLWQRIARAGQTEVDHLRSFRDDVRGPDCTPDKRRLIDQALQALSSSSSYQLCCWDEYWELELRGDQVVRLAY